MCCGETGLLRRRDRREPRGGPDRGRQDQPHPLQRLRPQRDLLRGRHDPAVRARLASASPVSGQLYELDAIAAVVIGGTSLAGGRATIVGTVLGVITFALVFD